MAENREILPRQIQGTERIQYGNSGVSYQQAWRVHEALREELEGSEIEGFKKLPGLLNLWSIGDSENRSTLSAYDGQFERCFIAPAATRTAFSHCRPFIALDGCHTKSRYQMILLVAATLDGNNEILPLAWAIVPIENADHWTWFLKEMKLSFEEVGSEGMVFISDRDKGLQTAVHEVFPESYHSHCCQHLADNVQKHYGLACRNLFWGAANAYN